jgi:predicted nucleotidyltransferase
MEPAELAEALRDDPALRGVSVLVLHGSRARRDHRPNSDWDFGFLGSPDVGRLSARLVEMVGTDAVDVVDLAGASALLRFRAGADGVLIAGDPAEFLRFRLQATQFWCDAGPVIRAAHDALLASL